MPASLIGDELRVVLQIQRKAVTSGHANVPSLFRDVGTVATAAEGL
jgi:hypothetical protein